jgi:methyl-accepting chemotaxis protein
VTDIMNEIASASQEQSSGIEQVNKAIAEMDNTTQQNAALVEQAAAAARSMQEQSEQLVAAVAVFRMEGSAATSRAGQAPMAAPVRATVPVLRAARGGETGAAARVTKADDQVQSAADEAAAADGRSEEAAPAQGAARTGRSAGAARARAARTGTAGGAGARAGAGNGKGMRAAAPAKPAAPVRATPPGDDWEEF